MRRASPDPGQRRALDVAEAVTMHELPSPAGDRLRTLTRVAAILGMMLSRRGFQLPQAQTL